MPIREDAINGVLGDVYKQFGVRAEPEETHRGVGKRPDVRLYRKYNDNDYVAVECKIGFGKTQKRGVLGNAERWLDRDDCLGAIAICYPPEIGEGKQEQLREFLINSQELEMLGIRKRGEIERWRKGGITDLIRFSQEILGGGAETQERSLQYLREVSWMQVQKLPPKGGKRLQVFWSYRGSLKIAVV